MRIGNIKQGVCRHRSILFKFICDAIFPSNILSARLIRGEYDSGGHAWNVVLLENKFMFVCDLMRDSKKILFPVDSADAAAYRRGGSTVGTVGGLSVMIPPLLINRVQPHDMKIPDYGIPEVTSEELGLSRGNILGQGAFGVVRQCLWRGLDVAVKVLKSHVSKEEFWKEMSIAAKLRHPQIVSCLALCRNPICVVMELLPHTLKSRLHEYQVKRVRQLTARDRGRILFQIGQAMQFLHSHNPPILHLDLKPENVLLDNFLNVRVADFGLAHVMRQSRMDMTQNIKGTPRYMSPEAFKGQLSKASDVYSYGIIVWETLIEMEPWQNVNDMMSLMQLVTSGQRPRLDRGIIKLNRNKGISEQIAQWIFMLWHKNVTSRPDFASICSQLKRWGVDTK